MCHCESKQTKQESYKKKHKRKRHLQSITHRTHKKEKRWFSSNLFVSLIVILVECLHLLSNLLICQISQFISLFSTQFHSVISKSLCVSSSIEGTVPWAAHWTAWTLKWTRRRISIIHETITRIVARSTRRSVVARTVRVVAPSTVWRIFSVTSGRRSRTIITIAWVSSGTIVGRVPVSVPGVTSSRSHGEQSIEKIRWRTGPSSSLSRWSGHTISVGSSRVLRSQTSTEANGKAYLIERTPSIRTIR